MTSTTKTTEGAHRAGWKRHRVADLLGCLVHRQPAPRHSFDADTLILPAVGDDLLPLIEDRLRVIESFGGVHVTIDPNFKIRECCWCKPDRPALATVRVYGQPALGDPNKPLTDVKTCWDCAVNRQRGPIVQALIEQDPASRYKIRVEVVQ